MTNPKRTKGNGGDDDAYVLDDTGDSTVEDIEHEMEVTAQEAADSTATRRAKAAEVSPAPEASAPWGWSPFCAFAYQERQ